MALLHWLEPRLTTHCFMSDDYSFFWIYVWLGILFCVLVVLALPPRYTELKKLIGIVTAFLVVTIGGPFTIKSTWEKYHDFDSGKLHEIQDLSWMISTYKDYGPKAPAIFESLLYIAGIFFLSTWVRAQYRKWRYNEPW